MRQKTCDKRQEIGDVRQKELKTETGDMKQEMMKKTGNKRQET